MIVVRVYGILVNEANQILLSDELIRGAKITKFCGGGLEEGEGTRDCLQREFKEEMDLDVEVLEHFYTTDFYQESAFRLGDQILSIYYTVRALGKMDVPENAKPFDFSAALLEKYETTKQIETFRFVDLKNYSAEDMTLPIDKLVAGLVRNKYV
jgi:ADP-ribose pyrophosphatase YjhB (NUDIX family)